MIPITGYSDRLSAAIGETIEFKVSSRLANPFRATLVRVVHADPNPAGPGMKIDELSSVFEGNFASVEKPIASGSCVRIADAPLPTHSGGLTVCARIFPTAIDRGEQCVASQWNEPKQAGFALLVGTEGVTALLWTAGSPVRVNCSAELAPAWYDVWFTLDPDRRTLRAGVASVFPGITGVPLFAQVEERAAHPVPNWTGKADILIGAQAASGAHGETIKHFNGKIEQPFIATSIRKDARRAPRLADVDLRDIFAAWDFQHRIDTLDVVDSGPIGLHGRLENLPVRAVTSSAWNGRDMCWRANPSHYAAIHFHDDDLHDAGWATDFAFTVPAGLRSGAYAMRLRVDGHQDYLPFYVTPALGRPTARIVFVAPTYTYQAYGNYARGNFDEALRERVTQWNAYPHNPDEHRDYGLSTYNLHSDGSGVAFASRWRPMLTFRPGFVTFNDARGSGCRHYIADSHLLDWLEHEGFDFDVVTDDELELHGSALLEPYAVVLTGTHPEYHTAKTLDAFAGYVRNGGHLAYLGGNGFYWRIAISDCVPGVLEIRRGASGTRAWASAPGEVFHALDGNQGGLWRESGRAPQKLVGIGFSSQGPFEGSPFRVNDAARDAPGGWILDGIPGGLIGDYGLSGGGAAGFELDSTCAADGSPKAFTLLAASEGHGLAFGPALDALLSHFATRDRHDPSSLLRAEMIYYESGRGGSVFSVGSITFCGGLSHAGYQNDISKLLRNYLTRAIEAIS